MPEPDVAHRVPLRRLQLGSIGVPGRLGACPRHFQADSLAWEVDEEPAGTPWTLPAPTPGLGASSGHASSTPAASASDVHGPGQLDQGSLPEPFQGAGVLHGSGDAPPAPGPVPTVFVGTLYLPSTPGIATPFSRFSGRTPSGGAPPALMHEVVRTDARWARFLAATTPFVAYNLLLGSRVGKDTVVLTCRDAAERLSAGLVKLVRPGEEDPSPAAPVPPPTDDERARARFRELMERDSGPSAAAQPPLPPGGGTRGCCSPPASAAALPDGSVLEEVPTHVAEDAPSPQSAVMAIPVRWALLAMAELGRRGPDDGEGGGGGPVARRHAGAARGGAGGLAVLADCGAETTQGDDAGAGRGARDRGRAPPCPRHRLAASVGALRVHTVPGLTLVQTTAAGEAVQFVPAFLSARQAARMAAGHRHLALRHAVAARALGRRAWWRRVEATAVALAMGPEDLSRGGRGGGGGGGAGRGLGEEEDGIDEPPELREFAREVAADMDLSSLLPPPSPLGLVRRGLGLLACGTVSLVGSLGLALAQAADGALAAVPPGARALGLAPTCGVASQDLGALVTACAAFNAARERGAAPAARDARRATLAAAAIALGGLACPVPQAPPRPGPGRRAGWLFLRPQVSRGLLPGGGRGATARVAAALARLEGNGLARYVAQDGSPAALAEGVAARAGGMVLPVTSIGSAEDVDASLNEAVAGKGIILYGSWDLPVSSVHVGVDDVLRFLPPPTVDGGVEEVGAGGPGADPPSDAMP
ncbi:hypothetical protein ACKKBF_B00350 [Auxenochlorella protothecoides x Auxenochlorella symbiontica]